MRLTFRQGIVRYQTDISLNPAFLQKHSLSGDYIDLLVNPDPTIVTFCHAGSDYLVEERKPISKAWGPLIAVGQTQFLYWDLNLLTGAMTRGFTLLPPLTSPTPPPTPANDQHWFDKTTNQMKVWSNTKWVVKVRCFAAEYSTNATIIPFLKGTQVGLANVDVGSGSIIYGKDDRPLRHQNGTLLTTEDELIVGRNNSSNVKFDASLIFAEAMEPIPKFHLVSYVAADKVALGSYMEVTRQIAGIVLEDLYTNEIGKIITHGRIQNDQWNFDPMWIGLPLFCGLEGEITPVPPPTGISQQVGLIQGVDTINFSIMTPVVISL